MKFYTDVHIALEAVHQLQHKGVDIIHCGDVGMSDADDDQHLLYAIEQQRILVSCDEDFERLHALWQTTKRQHSGIVYFRMADQCKSISIVVREILFLWEAADYQTDLYNQIWRAQG
jgi:predicted nuclease of predicted toxin-antitoxin system